MKNKILGRKVLLILMFIFCGVLPLFAAGSGDELCLRLREYTAEQKIGGNPDYLRPALGETSFLDPFDKKTYARTGLADQDAVIRAFAAWVVAEFGEARHIPALESAYGRERDDAAKAAIYRELIRMQYKYSPAKAAFIANKLRELLNPIIPKAKSQLETFDLVLGWVEDQRLYQQAWLLKAIKQRFCPVSAQICQRVEQAIKISEFSRQYERQGQFKLLLSAALQSPDPQIQGWAIGMLTKEDTALNQRYANELILESFAQKNRIAFALMDRLKQYEITQSENINPSFEFTDSRGPGVISRGVAPSGWQRLVLSKFPEGWEILVTPGKDNTVTWPSAKAHTYSTGLAVNNTAGQTRLINSRVEFNQGRKPKAIEFGVSYLVECPTGAVVPLSGCVGADSLELAVNIIFTNGQAKAERFKKENLKSYGFSNWENFSASFACPSGSDYAIASAQLEVVVSGRTNNFYLDNAYLRRSGSDFSVGIPKIGALTVPLQTLLAGALAEFRAEITAPRGEAVFGQWSSDIEGAVGSPVTGRNNLIASLSLNKAGEHTMFFSVKNAFGFEDWSVAATKVKVLEPTVQLSSSKDISIAISGNLPFSLAISLPQEALGAAGATVNRAEIIARKDPATTIITAPFICAGKSCTLNLDTARLATGRYEFFARVWLNSSGTITGPYQSNKLDISLINADGPMAIPMISQQSGQKVSFSGEYSEPEGGISSYLWDFGDGTTSAERNPEHVFAGSNTVADRVYKARLRVTTASGLSDMSEIEVNMRRLPLVHSLKVEPAIALLGEPVALSAEVNAFSGDAISGSWSSDLTGKIVDLAALNIAGAPQGRLTGRRVLAHNYAFTRAGNHLLIFKAQNKFHTASESALTASLTVVDPAQGLRLELAGAPTVFYLGDQISLQIPENNLFGLSSRGVTVNPRLYINGILAENPAPAPGAPQRPVNTLYTYNADTRSYLIPVDGLYSFMQSKGRKTNSGSVDTIDFQVRLGITTPGLKTEAATNSVRAQVNFIRVDPPLDYKPAGTSRV